MDIRCQIYIRKCLSKRKEVIDITVPNLFGLAKVLFPEGIINKNNPPINNGADRNGMFILGDCVIDNYVRNSKSVDIDDLVDFCKSDQAMKEEEIIQNFNTYMEKIKNREKNWDIKIYDYIVENYQKKSCFMT